MMFSPVVMIILKRAMLHSTEILKLTEDYFLLTKKESSDIRLSMICHLGRSVSETLRMVDALQFFEENGEVCPADWHKGDKGMKETQESVAISACK